MPNRSFFRTTLAAAGLAAAWLAASPAPGAVITFDFTNLPQGGALSKTRTFTYGSLELTVTALGQDEDALPNPIETEWVVDQLGKGLGVRDADDILAGDIDAVDGNRGNEELIFTFNQDVLFQQLTFADFSNSAFGGEIFFVLNDGTFGDFQTSGLNIAFFNADANGGAGNPNWQALPNYDFPANKQGPKSVVKIYVQDADSGVFVSSLTVEADIETVPEPGALTLLLGGSAAFALIRLRDRRSRQEPPDA